MGQMPSTVAFEQKIKAGYQSANDLIVLHKDINAVFVKSNTQTMLEV